MKKTARREDQVTETRSGQAEDQESNQSKNIIKIQEESSGSRRGRSSRSRYRPR